ncbi:MAG: hypothetical protein ACHQ53_13740 [Polyangiales bacterium]
MSVSSRPPARLGASPVAALIVALGPLLWLWFAVWRASYLALGRDQGIFQGVAWAIAHGDRLYSDLREINGPLASEIHMMARLFGGADSHVLRSFDLTVSALVFAFVGASVHAATSRAPSRIRAALWAAAGCSVLLAQYVSFYSYWDFTQRESFYDWFILSALACDVRARSSGSGPAARRWLLAAGALSITPWFGKPTCAVFTLVHVLMIVLSEPGVALSRRKQLRAFVTGIGLGALPQLVFLAAFCSVSDFLRSYLIDNPRYYVYIWPKGLLQIVATESHAGFFPLPIALALATLGLIAVGSVSRRMIGMALFPVLGIALDLLQNKAFPYHLHPVTAGCALLAVVLVCQVASSADEADATDLRGLAPLAIGLACLVAYQTAHGLIESDSLRADWAPRAGSNAKRRLSPVFLAHFDRADFGATGLANTAEFLKRYTRPKERIQTYGMDPYLLALAERHSATPYIYDIDLNADSVLEGIQVLGASPKALTFAKNNVKRHADDLAARVRHSPPAAFVFFDYAPFTFPRSGFADFAAHAADAARFVTERYVYAKGFGQLQIFMRRDLWPARQKWPAAR